MKIVKVTIRRGGIGEPTMKYPAVYDAAEVDRLGMGPGKINHAGIVYSGGLSRGEDTEETLIVLPDVMADSYAADPDMEVIGANDADRLMERWRLLNGVPEDSVNDPQRIAAISAKLAAGLPLSKEDNDALNSSSRVPGIVRSRKGIRDRVTGLTE